MVCTRVHRHTAEEESRIYPFLGLFHSGCKHPPGDDGLVDAFKTFHLWSLYSRVEPGGKFTGTSLCLKKTWLGEKGWGMGQLVTGNCWKKSFKFVKLPSIFSPSMLHHPSPLHLQFGLKTVYVMMVPVQFHSGKLNESLCPTTLRTQEHQSVWVLWGRERKAIDLNWVRIMC